MIEVLLSIKSKSAVFRKKNNQLCTVLLAFSFDMDGRKSKIDLKMTCIRSLKLLGMDLFKARLKDALIVLAPYSFDEFLSGLSEVVLV